jgi:RPM1-interacting protein 4
LPKFGAWDAKDPTAGEGFTMIFQKASVEKKEGGPVRIPQMNEPAGGSYEDPHQRQPSERSRKQTQSSVSSYDLCLVIIPAY